MAPLEARRRSFCSHPRVLAENPHGFQQPIFVAWVNSYRRFSGYFRASGNIGGDDRTAASHGLENGQAETFVEGWKNESESVTVKADQFLGCKKASEYSYAVDFFIIRRTLIRELEYKLNTALAPEPPKRPYNHTHVFARLVVGDMEEVGLRSRIGARCKGVAIDSMMAYMDSVSRNAGKTNRFFFYKR